MVNQNLAKNYSMGFQAFKQVESKEVKGSVNRIIFHQASNPMRKNTTSYREWQRGWNDAYFKNLEKLNGLGARS